MCIIYLTFTVIPLDDYGRDIMPEQNTKPSENLQPKCVIFNTEIHIQKSMEELPKCMLHYQSKI